MDGAILADPGVVDLQEYVQALSSLLDNTESPEAQVQLQAWVRELSALQLAVVVLNPKGFRLFQIRQMDNFSQPEQHPTADLWRHVYVSPRPNHPPWLLLPCLLSPCRTSGTVLTPRTDPHTSPVCARSTCHG